MSFGYLVDFECPPRRALGGTIASATRIAEGAPLEPDLEACTPCRIADLSGGPGCIGIVSTPISAAAEQWLVTRLPDSIDLLAGEIIRQAVAGGSDGARGRALRERSLLSAAGQARRSWGGFFRRFSLTSDQIIEQMFCAGDIEPAHALAVLVELGAIAVDGRVPSQPEDGAALAEIVERQAERVRRSQSTVTPTPSDEPSTFEIKRYLRALHAAFCVDKPLRVFQD